MHFKSNFEELVFQAIKIYTLKHLIVKKEVQWSKIFGDLHFKNRYVDFFFPQIQLIIEANGNQHYEPTSFTNDESMILALFTTNKSRSCIKSVFFA
jgi:very-short-patch-repair endonuclease